jgi:hypothetical protein
LKRALGHEKVYVCIVAYRTTKKQNDEAPEYKENEEKKEENNCDIDIKLTVRV